MVTGVNIISPQTIVDLGGYVLMIIKKLTFSVWCGGFSFCKKTREMCTRYCYLGTQVKTKDSVTAIWLIDFKFLLALLVQLLSLSYMFTSLQS